MFRTILPQEVTTLYNDCLFELTFVAGDNDFTMRTECYGRELHTHIPFCYYRIYQELLNKGKFDYYIYFEMKLLEQDKRELHNGACEV